MRSAGKQLLPEDFHKIQFSAEVFQGVCFQLDGKESQEDGVKSVPMLNRK